MRFLVYSLLIGAMALGCLACDEKKEKVDEKPFAMELEDPVIPPAAFTSFVNGFQRGMEPQLYDGKWLLDFFNENKVREISPKVCEEFIHNQEVWHHVANGGKQEKIRLSADKPYYYIGQFADTGSYITLMFSDLEEEATETYLTTYTKDGKFISGIVIQAAFRDSPQASELSYERTCRIVPKHTPTLIITDAQAGKGSATKVYEITLDGIIQPNQRAS